MSDGTLALTFDDGPVEDHEQVYPVLRERGVPASLAVVPDWIDGPESLSTDRLRELADAGWEVMAHGRRHRYLQAHALAADAAAGDDRLVLDSAHVFPDEDHGVYAGDAFEVTDGERCETVVLAAKGTTGTGGDARPFVRFEESLGADFEAGETVVRPAEAQLRDEIAGSKRALEKLGFAPTTFALPYDAGDARAWRAVAESFDALADAAVRSLPNPPDPSPLDLRRYYLETDKMRMTEVETYLDLVAERGGVGILAGHSAWDTVPPERVAAVVEAAHERDIEVTTVRDAVL